ADRNRSHWSTSKTPSYTKSVSWQHHLYLDTVVILGSIGNQLLGHERWWFALGCLLASCMWFTSLSLGAARFSPVLRKPKIKRVIDFTVGVIMWLLAGQLGVQLLAS
ncbi:LysE family transporter, partial [Escherichia coli]|uniref:LysE/ArgO family amino acid transporter n=1 Tax=Escherichia coli TaxID=562 RepID=UPI0015C4BEEC